MNNSGSIFLTKIQRFSLHDGPGIRTTVFLKGCSLRCPWCSNPENIKSIPEHYVKNGIQGVYGEYYSYDKLVMECIKDKAFYAGELKRDEWKIDRANKIDLLPGGVTFSGGEALLQMENLVLVCNKLHEHNIHIAVETCLFVPEQMIKLAINYIDFFYVDVKILDVDQCKEIEKGDLRQYISNIVVLMKSDVPVVVRIPVIGKYTDDDKNRKAVKELLTRYKNRVLKVELIKEHNMAESKYKTLGMEINYTGVDDLLMEQYKDELNETGIDIEICKI